MTVYELAWVVVKASFVAMESLQSYLILKRERMIII